MRERPGQAWSWILTAAVLVILLAVLAVTTMARLRRTEELMRNYLASEGALIVRSLEGAARAGMRQNLFRNLLMQSLVEEMAQEPHVLYLAVITPGGEYYVAGSKGKETDLARIMNGLPPQLVEDVEGRKPVHMFIPGELVLGRTFEPLKAMLESGRPLPRWVREAPEWACNFPEGQEGRGMGMGMGWGRRHGGEGPEGHHGVGGPPPPRGNETGPAEAITPGPPRAPEGREKGAPGGQLRRAYALVRISTEAMDQDRARQVRESMLLALLIFLSVGAAGLGLVFYGRRKTRELERLRAEVAANQHLAAVGRLSAGVAHEIRNPLSALRGLVQLLAKGREAGDPKAGYAQAAVEEVDRLERVVSGLLEYSRPREPRRVSLDLSESARGALQFMKGDAKAASIEFRLEAEPDLPQVSADPDQVRQILVNLMLNSLEAVNGAGTVTLTLARDPKGVMAVVEDSGPGLPPGDPEQLFDPFFSTRDRGTGLGLALARRMARANGGELTAGNAPEGGARMSLVLPPAGA